MRILITGGGGFLGRNVIGKLLADGHALVCLDSYAAPFLKDCGVEFHQGDMSDPELVGTCMAGCDAVLHMACTTLPKTSNDDPHFDVLSNVGGTIRLLDAAVAARVKRFVFLSSGGTVYGRPVSVPIREDHPTCPECSYGITKLAIEKYLGLYRRLHGLSTCALRLANPYGEYQRYKGVQGAVSVFCYRALRGEPVEVWGDGSVVRDFIYVGDAVDAIERALLREDVVGEINVGGGGGGVSLNDLLAAIERISGRRVERRYLPGRGFDVPVNVLDIARAERLLGWRPELGLEAGLARTLRWIGEQENGR